MATRAAGSRLARAAFLSGAGLSFAVLLLAPVAVVLHSFSPTAHVQAPPSGLSLRWYAGLLDQPRLLSGLGTSLMLAALSSAAAVLIGAPAALGIARGSLRGREFLLSLLLSPLALPGLVLGVGLLTSVSLLARTSGAQLAGTLAPLAVAHLLITVPWVTRSVVASLESTDPLLEEQARSLGAGPLATLFLVTLPGARPGIVAGAVSAFVISFGNFALSLLLASGRTVTLPVAIFEAVDRYQDPTVAAISTVAIAITGVAAVCAERLSRNSGAPRARGPA